MKSTPTLRSSIQNKSQSLLTRTRSLRLPVLTRRLFLLTLVSFVAVAALIGVAASANKANRAAKARAEQSANTKSGISPALLNDKQPNAPLAPAMVATLSDNITAATTVAPGANINYTATITNNGAVVGTDDATNLNYSDTLDANTTLVPGSVHASPIAFNDTYNWVGNTQLDTVARALPAVTANDVAVNAPGGTDTFTLTAITGGATALGGVVTLASPSGAFTYTPPLGRPNIADGATAQDSFTYTITNNADGSLTSTGTVKINLTGRVWYLQAGAAGDGRSNTPSGSPAAMSTAADKSTDFFYIFSNAGSLDGPFSVDAGQQLLGQGVNLVVNSITLFTAAAPTPTTTNTAGSCVALAGAPGNNTLSGFNIGNCTGGTAITGANVGTLDVNTLLINTNGQGLDLTGSGNPAVNVVLGGLTSTGGAKNVNLVNLGGTITLASGALSGATGNAFDVSGGIATIIYSGTISNSGAKQVNIANMTGGSVALSGAVGGTGTGINLTTNTGATISFSGGIALSTGAATAFNATGGGTITATQNNASIVNTLTTATATALNVSSTTIGANGLTFRSINAPTASGNSGIILNATGSSGGLTVTGNGGSCTAATPTCTGGTISNKTTVPNVSLTNTKNVNLSLMNIQSSSFEGILGSGVDGFTLASSLVRNNSTAGNNRCGIKLTDTLNAVSFSDDAVTGNFNSNVQITTSPSSTAAMTTLTVANGTYSSSTQNAGFLVDLHGSAALNTASVTGATFSSNFSKGIQFQQNDNATMGNSVGAPATGTITVSGCTFSGNDGHASFESGGNGTGNSYVRFVSNVNMTNALTGSAINFGVANSGTGTFKAFCDGNVIGTLGSPGSGSASGEGISAKFQGRHTAILTVTNNQVRDVANGAGAFGARGIDVEDLGDPGANLGQTQLDVKITGNTVSEVYTAFPQYAIYVAADAQGSGTSGSLVHAEIHTNTVPAIASCDTGPCNTTAGMIDFETVNSTGTRAGTLFQCTVAACGAAGPGGTVSNEIASTNTGTSGKTCSFLNGGTLTLTATPPNTVARLMVPDSAPINMLSTIASAPVVTKKQAVPIAAKASLAATGFEQSVVPDRIAMLGKGSPKASAAEVARIYRSERTLSHHAVRNNFKFASQDRNAPTSGETITLNTIATFPAGGKSITIKYSATVNTTVLTARQASTQGTVSGGNFASVLTDDPDVGGTQATVTLLDTTLTWTGATDTNWNTAGNWARPGPVVSSYAPGVSNPAVNDVVIPSVGAQPNIGTTDIGVFSLNLANGRTLTITSPRTLTIGGSPGGDLTLDGIISGGFLNLGTGAHIINNAGGTGSISATNVTTVLSGSTVTLANNLQAGALAVNAGGSMNITGRTLSLNGSGAALTVGGTLTTAPSGVGQEPNAPLAVLNSTVVFNGTAAQTAAGIAYNNLTINNTTGAHVTGVTLTGNATVNGVLTLTSSDLATGANTLTMPATATSGPASGATDVVGNVKRTGFTTGGAALSFGNPFNTIRITAGTSPTDINVLLAKNAPTTYPTAVLRSYTITPNGGAGITATVRLHYRQVELNGNSETPTVDFNLRRLVGTWKAVVPTARNVGVAEDNWLENNAVTAFSEWTFKQLAPTASGGAVTGRIVDANGNAVEGAVVRLNGTQNRKFITDANGVYRFDNVETNGFYTVTPSRANYSFSPASRSFSQIGENTEATFGATVASSNLVNPLDTPEYFVRQHYIDFLGREPDEAGFNFWSDQIIECGADQSCIERRRENVSAAYFLSIEFQQTGGLVDGLYRAGYGVSPQYSAFMPDTRTVGMGVVVGQEGWQARLQANKEAFANAFVNRAAFHQMYDGMDNSLFVDTLIQHTGVTFTSGERDALVTGLGTGTMTRGDALRSIAENSSFVNAKFNETFVMMEYFGYLRRDADAGGFAFWLSKLNQFNGNFEQADMVKAFIVSSEFRNRFPR